MGWMGRVGVLCGTHSVAYGEGRGHNAKPTPPRGSPKREATW